MLKVSKLRESRELLPQPVLEVVQVDLDPLHLALGSGLLDEGEEAVGGHGRRARLQDGQHVDLIEPLVAEDLVDRPQRPEDERQDEPLVLGRDVGPVHLVLARVLRRRDATREEEEGGGAVGVPVGL